MSYIPPYAQLRGKLNLHNSKGDLTATVRFDDLEMFIRYLLRSTAFDESWYRTTYPDIDAAIADGLVESGREHFIRDGYFEGRLPFAMTVDEDWYLSHYADIRSAVAAGIFPSATEHFASHGYAEGRIPSNLT